MNRIPFWLQIVIAALPWCAAAVLIVSLSGCSDNGGGSGAVAGIALAVILIALSIRRREPDLMPAPDARCRRATPECAGRYTG